MDNKEYKVITSNTPIFANSIKLKQILAEEAQAGWDLEELIDNSKIRVWFNGYDSCITNAAPFPHTLSIDHGDAVVATNQHGAQFIAGEKPGEQPTRS